MFWKIARWTCALCEDSRTCTNTCQRKIAAGTSVVQFLNYRTITGQSVGRWKQRSFGSPTLLLLDTKINGKFHVHFLERWCISRYGHFSLGPNISEVRTDEPTDMDCACFLLKTGKPVVFPSLENNHICEDCRRFGQSPWLRYALGEEERRDLL